MSFSLYAATVPSYRQILSAVAALLGKAETFCTERGIAAHDIIHARLAERYADFRLSGEIHRSPLPRRHRRSPEGGLLARHHPTAGDFRCAQDENR